MARGKHAVLRGLPKRRIFLVICALALLTGLVVPVGAVPATAVPQTVVDIDFLGEVTVATGTDFAGTEVGGLSAITYNPAKGVYYALSDDQGQIDPVRYYTLTVDVSDGTLDAGDVTFTGVTFLHDDTDALFGVGALDPEGFTIAQPGVRFLSSEGNAITPIDPFIKRYDPNGYVTATLPIPDKFLPDGTSTSGIRHNLALESLAVSPNHKTLYSAVEGALFQDGPAADVDQSSFARMLVYDLAKKSLTAEYVYVVDPVADPPVPSDAFRVAGLVELLPIDDVGTLIAMERSFSVGAGNTVTLHEVTIPGATDVSGENALYVGGSPITFTPVGKQSLLDFGDLVSVVDNIEGMTFGPPLPDGRQLLLVVSDNNFSPAQFTQFIALAMDIQPKP